MPQGYIRIQIDFAHLRAQLTACHGLKRIFEINIGTVLIPDSKFKRAGGRDTAPATGGKADFKFQIQNSRERAVGTPRLQEAARQISHSGFKIQERASRRHSYFMTR
jgi:hypothetical protein